MATEYQIQVMSLQSATACVIISMLANPIMDVAVTSSDGSMSVSEGGGNSHGIIQGDLSDIIHVATPLQYGLRHDWEYTTWQQDVARR